MSVTVKYYGYSLLVRGYLIEATTQRGGCMHVELSDFSHIYDLKIKELHFSISKRWGSGGWLVQPSYPKEVFNSPEEIPDSIRGKPAQ
jgi:hypothetical protein